MERHKKILVVDDDSNFSYWVSRALSEESESYEVASVTTAQDAFNIVQSQPPDLVLLDLRLGLESGIDLLKAIKEIESEIQVVIMTGYASTETAIDALRQGAYDYLTKPIKLDQLLSLARRALEKQEFLQERKRLIHRLSDATTQLEEINLKLKERESLLAEQISGLNKLLEELSQLTQEVGPHQLLEKSLQQTIEIMQVKAGALLLFEEGKLVVKVVNGLEELLSKGMVINLETEEIGRTFERGEAKILRYNTPLKGGFTELVTANLEKQGLIVLADGRNQKKFEEEDARLLQTIVRVIFVFLQNFLYAESLKREHLQVLKALITAQGAKDPHFVNHSEKVREYAIKIAKRLNLSEEEQFILSWSALLHDLGKLGLKEELLQKTGTLTEAEYKQIQGHSLLGEKIIEPIGFLRKVRPLIRHHHERYDGKGYPDHLAGEKIPLGARILAVAEAYDNLTTEMPFRQNLSIAEALQELHQRSNHDFDPKIVSALAEELGVENT
ncbi:MAG: HD domain-containing phosphohydrolase [Candidatus Edwardsbacteria bacterium]